MMREDTWVAKRESLFIWPNYHFFGKIKFFLIYAALIKSSPSTYNMQSPYIP